jgi:hypothetical protein
MRRDSNLTLTATPLHSSTGRRVCNLATTPPVPPSLVQVAGGFQNASVPVAVTPSSSVTAGNLLVVGFATNHLAGQPVIGTISDTLGTSWSGQVAHADNTVAGIEQCFFWGAVPAGVGSDTITVTPFTGGDFNRVFVHEVAGVTALDQTAVNTGAAYPLSAGPVTTTAASEILVALGNSENGVVNPGTGWTIALTQTGESTEYQVVSTAGSYTATFPGDAGSSPWACSLVTFH